MIRHRILGTRAEVRKFGLLFGGISGAVGTYLFFTESATWMWPAGLSLFFLTSGLFVYPVLRPVFLWWMKFAQLLAWINARVILSVAFYLVITPIGLLLRLFGKDLLDQKFDQDVPTYWKKREQKEFDRSRFEHLY